MATEKSLAAVLAELVIRAHVLDDIAVSPETLGGVLQDLGFDKVSVELADKVRSLINGGEWKVEFAWPEEEQ